MSILKKIPNEDKKYLSPEARYKDTMILPNGRVYFCVEGATTFLFAGWVRITPWRNPIQYVRIRHRTWRAFR